MDDELLPGRVPELEREERGLNGVEERDAGVGMLKVDASLDELSTVTLTDPELTGIDPVIESVGSTESLQKKLVHQLLYQNKYQR